MRAPTIQGLVSALFYSVKLHKPSIIALELSASSSSAAENRAKIDILSFCHAFAALEFIPLALCFDSALMGFFAVSFSYQTLGFTVYCFGLGFSVGFTSLTTLERCCITSKTM